MCKHLRFYVRPNLRPTLANSMATTACLVPCGKCVDCLISRKQDFSTRVYFESLHWRSIHFLTLTYNNEHLPLASTLEYVDLETGEVTDKHLFQHYEPFENCVFDSVRDSIVEIPPSRQVRYSYFRNFPVQDGYLPEVVVTPTLRRSDVSSLFKIFRIYEKRRTGETPDFKVAYVGEYGGKFLRPHYHCLIFGLSTAQCRRMASIWSSRKHWHFGTYNLKVVDLSPDNASKSRLKVANYLGKYCSKGRFDNPAVLAGYCEKGRLCTSLKFGEVSDHLISYHRAYDLYGPYNIDTWEKGDPADDFTPSGLLSPFERSRVAAEVVKRSLIALPGQFDKNGLQKRVPIPKYLKRKFFYIEDKYYDKTKEQYQVRKVASSLQSEVSSLLRDIFISKHEREFKSFYPSEPCSKVPFSTFAKFSLRLQSALLDAGEAKKLADFKSELFAKQKDEQ